MGVVRCGCDQTWVRSDIGNGTIGEHAHSSFVLGVQCPPHFGGCVNPDQCDHHITCGWDQNWVWSEVGVIISG